MSRLHHIVVLLLVLATWGCGGSSHGPGDGAGGGADGTGGGNEIWVGRDTADTAPAPDAVPDTAPDTDSGEPTDTAPDTVTDTVTDIDTVTVTDALSDAPDAPDAPDAGDTPQTPDVPVTPDVHVPPDIGEIGCLEDGDCETALPFHDLCDRVWCEDARCRIEPIEDCCIDSTECFDWDPCTVDRCSDATRQCENAPLDDPACCSGTWTVQTGFEDGLPDGWEIETPEGARAYWHVSAARAMTGDRALVFLDPATGSYGTGYHELGAVRGPWFDVPIDAEQPLFRFDLYLDTEWRLFTEQWADPSPLVYDRLTLHLDNGDAETEVWSSYSIDVQGHTCAGGCTFRSFTLDLGDFRGQRVRPVFRFDTGDGIDNDYSGVALDNVGMQLACGLPPECFDSGDCDDADRCTDDVCREGVCAHERNYAPNCCYDYERASWQFDPFSLSGFEIQPMEPLVRWHVSERRPLTGSSSLRFGHVANETYNAAGEAVAGRALSPAVPLAAWLNTTLNFFVWMDIEPFDPVTPFRDVFEIVVLPAVGGDETVVWHRGLLPPEHMRAWIPVEISLAEFAGQMIRIRFQFSSGDSEQNLGEGVYLDDIRVIRRCN